jgi:hypothetical protein
MEKLKIDSVFLDFIKQNLSAKTQDYITSNLFKDSCFIDKFLDQCPLTIDMKSDEIIGVVDDLELKLFVVKDSLQKRINGTVNRIEGTSNSEGELIEERKIRLDELFSDYKKVFEHLHTLLEIRFSKQIENVFIKNHNILMQRYHWSEYNDYSGYIFKLNKSKNIIMANKYRVYCGD